MFSVKRFIPLAFFVHYILVTFKVEISDGIYKLYLWGALYKICCTVRDLWLFRIFEIFIKLRGESGTFFSIF